MDKKKVIASISIFCLMVGVFSFSVFLANEETLQTSSSITTASTLSNKKIGWGIKRVKNHEQPDVGSQNKKWMDEYKGICLGNKEKKYVYLTFDEGYEAGYTEKILEVLKQNKVKATFFITAHYLNSQPELVKKMVDAGQILGNHTVNHKSMPDLSDEQVKKEVMDLHSAIYEKTGYEMKYIRPPMGEFSQRTLDITNSLGYTTVMWSVAYMDWDEKNQPSIEEAKSKILENIHPGAVILLHGNSKTNTDILDSCIKEIRNMGYEIKSLDEFEK